MNNKNYLLAFFELLSSILIVLIHIQFPGLFGYIISSCGRIGVPLFFMTSGYFLMKDNISKEELRIKLLNRIKRITIILIYTTVITFIFLVITYHDSLKENVFNRFTIFNLISCIFFSAPMINGVSWFMLAQIVCYIIMYLMAPLYVKKNHFIIKFNVIIISFWIALGFIADYTKLVIFGSLIDAASIDNSWFSFGMCFISLGMLLRLYKDKLVTIKNSVLIPISIISFVLMIIEFVITNYYQNFTGFFYYMTVICVISIFILCIKNPQVFNKSKILNMRTNLSLFIYIYHMPIIVVLREIIKDFSLSGIFVNYFLPITAVLITIMLSFISASIITYYKIKKSNG